MRKITKFEKESNHKFFFTNFIHQQYRKSKKIKKQNHKNIIDLILLFFSLLFGFGKIFMHSHVIPMKKALKVSLCWRVGLLQVFGNDSFGYANSLNLEHKALQMKKKEIKKKQIWIYRSTIIIINPLRNTHGTHTTHTLPTIARDSRWNFQLIFPIV